MKERNYDNLRRHLDGLPEHTPPAGLWRKLEGRLADQSAAPLNERLPSYAPPPDVWNHIGRELDAQPVAPLRLAHRRPRRNRWLAVAAAVALLLSAGAFVINRSATTTSGPTITYAYTQEPAPARTPVNDWDEDEASFERVRSAIAERDEPVLNVLASELDELTSAREEVKAMLASYGEDAGMVKQLAAIERERSDVYRRIIVEL